MNNYEVDNQGLFAERTPFRCYCPTQVPDDGGRTMPSEEEFIHVVRQILDEVGYEVKPMDNTEITVVAFRKLAAVVKKLYLNSLLVLYSLTAPVALYEYVKFERRIVFGWIATGLEIIIEDLEGGM